MFVDARSIESGARIACDVCIIGAGAAGISLARELSGRGRVCVLESGGLEFDLDTQRLYQGRGLGLVGDGYLETSRLRYFGGSTNHWWGMCAPLDAHDFEARPWVPHSGWPVSRAELDPYYARAQAICQLGPFDYEPDAWDPDPPPLGPRIRRGMWQYGPPTRFGEVYREELRASPNVDVHLFANAVDLVAAESGRRVERVEVKTLSGRQFAVEARTLVLAAGGIENPRLLLGSDGVMKGGLGNGRDRVGRFFMEHPHALPAGEILFEDPRLAAWSDKQIARNIRFLINLGIRPEVQRRLELLNGCVQVVRPWGTAEQPERSLLGLLRDLALGTEGGPPRRAELHARLEQAPNPESRVRLSDDRDALGQRRVVLDWRLGTHEPDSLRRTLESLAEDLAAAGTARVRIGEPVVAGTPEFVGGQHHMGTTRMSDDPATGVVDRDCRVHGIENLYVAGSSVFPTTGWANPTLTIVALALRLADHLKRGLAS